MYVLYVQFTSIYWTIFRVHSGELINDLTQLQFLAILFKHDKLKKIAESGTFRHALYYVKL